MVGLLDLDGFKSVNDRHGHAAGDSYLAAVAHRLSEALSENASVYRLSGDEFLIVWDSTPPHPLDAASRVLAALRQPLTIDDHPFRPTASLGLALPGPDLSGTDLIGAADYAMYVAKQHPNRPAGAHSAAGLYNATRPPTSTDRRTQQRRLVPPESQNPENTVTKASFDSVAPAAAARSHMNYIETVGELINALSVYDPACPVMSALQPGYPMAGSIMGMGQTCNGVIWIATDTVDYLPSEARAAVGW